MHKAATPMGVTQQPTGVANTINAHSLLATDMFTGELVVCMGWVGFKNSPIPMQTIMWANAHLQKSLSSLGMFCCVFDCRYCCCNNSKLSFPIRGCLYCLYAWFKLTGGVGTGCRSHLKCVSHLFKKCYANGVCKANAQCYNKERCTVLRLIVVFFYFHKPWFIWSFAVDNLKITHLQSRQLVG